MRRLACILALLFFVPVFPSTVVAAAPTEEQVKAAFLINFPKYVEWSAECFGDTDSPYVFAIVGDEGVATAARVMAEGRILNNRRIVIADEVDGDEAPPVHVLFIADSAMRDMEGVLTRLDGNQVLTVGEHKEFLRSGGIVNLARRDRKVRLEVSLDAAESRTFRISSKLLAVADVVRGKRK